MYGNRYGCMIASFTSVEAGERDLRLERQPFEPKRANAQRVEERRRLPWPGTVIQLVEGDNRTFGHARHERLEGAFRWLVQVEIQIEKRHDKMRIALDILSHRRDRVTLDQLDLRNVPNRAVHIEDCRGFGDFGGGVGGES